MKKVIFFAICTILSAAHLNAQNKAVIQTNEGRSEMPKASSNSNSSMLGVELTVYKEDNSVEVVFTENNLEPRNITTVEDKMKYKQELSAMGNLERAQSFLDVIQYTSGKLKLQSHQILNLENKIVHYFVFFE
jgi:uncharacterized protein YacL (UPF0231 family)